MTKIAKELKTACPKCKAKAGKKCRNTKTGNLRATVHDVRLASTKGSKKQTKTNTPKPMPVASMTEEQKQVGKMLETKIAEILGDKATAKFIGPVNAGPVITTYRFQPQGRCKVSHLEGLSKDFATLLSAESVLVKRLPGESAVGVFVPNQNRKYINFRDTIQPVMDFMKKKTEDGHLPIPLNLGQDAEGYPVIEDLTMQPHLLIAGTTGGGKSTLLHGIISAMGWAMTSKELKLILSDTKAVEFTHFKELPHLQFPIAESVFMTMQAMEWAKQETQIRLNKIGAQGVRNIHDYNKLPIAADQKLPFVVIIIDELADLMGDGVDKDIAKAASGMLQVIVQRSRSAGVYVIAGTQRPGVATVKGAIKANFPSRLTFRLPSQQDSRTVIGLKGAESLMSRGDMLYTSSVRPELRRLHAPYSSIDDVKAAVQYVIHRERAESLKQQQSAADALGQKGQANPYRVN